MIKKWILKAIVQKTISFLPGSHRINFLFQKYVTRGVQLTEHYFEDRLIHARKHLESFDRHATKPLEETLELGTGWYPVVPIAMFLRGANKIHTVDISKLSDKQKIVTAIDWFLTYAENGKLKQYLNPVPERLEQLKYIKKHIETHDFNKILATMHIFYAIADARELAFPKQSIDLIHSNNTFEHVYPSVLKGILQKFKTLVHPKGIQSHFIDMSDHFAHFDKTINIYHFLSYSDKQWDRIDNSVQPQNRWRLSEYQTLYQTLDINIAEVDARPGDLEALNTISLAEKYKSFDTKDLAISHAYLISKSSPT